MEITKNKVVSFDYTLRGMDNEVIDISGAAPLVYLHGYGNIIPGLEKAMEGKKAGASFKLTVPAVEAYGEWDQMLVTTVPRSVFDGAEKLEEGMEFEAQFPEGSQIVKIIKVTDAEVTLDGNHSLAGMDLNFEITIREIRDASEEEITHGHAHGHEGCGAGGAGCAGCSSHCPEGPGCSGH